LERGVHLRPGRREGLETGVEPRPVEGPHAEHVRAGPVERVPQAHGYAEVLVHPLAEDEPVGLIDLERQGVGRVEPAERDRPGDVLEEVHGGSSSRAPARATRRRATASLPRICATLALIHGDSGRTPALPFDPQLVGTVAPIWLARHATTTARTSRSIAFAGCSAAMAGALARSGGRDAWTTYRTSSAIDSPTWRRGSRPTSAVIRTASARMPRTL